MSRFVEEKNIPWIVRIFSEVIKKEPEYFLVIVGQGKEEKNIREAIKKYGMENNCCIEPWAEGWERDAYYRQTDCFLLPSLHEGFGMTVIEANSMGKKIIMNDVGCANYELPPSDTVTILPINDEKKWIEAITNL